ncbi:MAG TPA: FAD-dependent thymidylate synthase [Candidatus Woesebacteria bacterium]|nr:FAD-dependent thymidylate synthase [Candidatus Woesebacteria bacterium]
MEITKRGFPFLRADTFLTPKGIRYLKTPGMAMISRPEVDITGLEDFLKGFPEDLLYMDYLNDEENLTPAETLVKAAGQWCYLSLGPDRTKNIDAAKYFRNIKEQKHGSIMEHVTFTMAIWGVSRSFTHELVRHRAGCGFSQVSQRYVGEKALRFVERPEFVADPVLHKFFIDKIEQHFDDYVWLSDYLYKKQAEGEKALSAERKSDLRKKVRQTARAELPNETEAPIIVSGNVRAWRNILEQRVSEHAEVEIRRVAYNIFESLKPELPNLLSDYEVVTLSDGTLALKSPYSKV